jgi:CRP-like cAMP-binding protein
VKPASDLIRGVLEKLPLLQGVNPDAVRELATQSALVRAARGEVILRRGDRVANLYALACGSVKARLQQPHGDETVLALLGPGACFGKTEVLLGRPSQLDLVALGDTMLVAIRAACVLAMMERNLRFSRNLTRALAERNLKLVGELEAGLLHSDQRLAAYLQSIAEPAVPPNRTSARLPVSKTLLAGRLGIKKETLSRLLRRFSRAGLIEVRGRDIAILDALRLEQAAQAIPGRNP